MLIGRFQLQLLKDFHHLFICPVVSFDGHRLVAKEGLEPSRLAPTDFKSVVSAISPLRRKVNSYPSPSYCQGQSTPRHLLGGCLG